MLPRLVTVVGAFLTTILAANDVCAQAVEPDEFRVVMKTRQLIVAASILGGEVTQSRYVLMGIRNIGWAGKKSRLVGEYTYAVDCASPRSVASIWGATNSTPVESEEKDDWKEFNANLPRNYKLADLDYLTLERRAAMLKQIRNDLDLHSPDGATVAAEYACSGFVASNTARKQLALRLIETGGLPDLRELTCTYGFPGVQPDSASVRFSESAQVLQWNGVWQDTAFFRENEIGLSFAKYLLTINRRSGRITVSNESSTASGTCELTTATPRKF